MARPFSIIVAATKKLGIGLAGGMPWRLPKEMEYFRQKTTTTINAASATNQNAVIMGRKTWSEEGVPLKFRPLDKRVNVVLTSQPAAFKAELSQKFTPAQASSVLVCSSLPAALELLSTPPLSNTVEKVFVIGGGAVYKEAIAHPQCTEILFTRIMSDDVKCDTFFPEIPAHFKLTSASELQTEDNLIRKPAEPLSYVFEVHSRAVAAAGAAAAAVATSSTPAIATEKKSARPAPNGTGAADLKSAPADWKGAAAVKSVSTGNREEQQYLDIVRDVIDSGVTKRDRTGVGTVSKFGCLMRFSLRNGQFPLLTTKNVYWKGVVEELLWMLKGCTDSKVLSEKKVKIWDDNGSRSFLDKLGFKNREVGDLGPVYGFQWRHFGAKYVDCKTDYSGQGFDQIADVIHQIKTNPDSRRILFSAWNPADLKQMALPPCHVSAQFTVANGELSCLMSQRSCDLGLGVPFNIASYALLTVLIADVCGLKPGEFVHSLGDYHVYLNHVEPLKEQLARVPRAFPTLRIKPRAKPVSDISEYTMADLELTGYDPYPTVKMAMAV